MTSFLIYIYSEVRPRLFRILPRHGVQRTECRGSECEAGRSAVVCLDPVQTASRQPFHGYRLMPIPLGLAAATLAACDSRTMRSVQDGQQQV